MFIATDIKKQQQQQQQKQNNPPPKKNTDFAVMTQQVLTCQKSTNPTSLNTRVIP